MAGGPSGKSADSPLIYNFADTASPWSDTSIPGTASQVLDSRLQLGIGYTTDVSFTPMATMLRTVPRLSMSMPPEAMYPLRKEFHASVVPRLHRFPLRGEFKAQ